MTGPPSRNGFTLVEVMVALAVFGLIAAAGVGLLAFSVRAQAGTVASLDATGALTRTSAALGADLAQAAARSVRDAGGTLLPAFAGEGQALRLVRGGWSNPDGAARASLQRVEWRLDGESLVRQGWPMLDGAEPLPAASMLDRVRSIAWRYRVAGAWTDRWDGAGGVPLPQAAELRVVRADGTALRMLFLIGPPTPPRADPVPAGTGDGG